jgi:hypothetical protein
MIDLTKASTFRPDPSMNNEVRIRCEARTDRAQCRSSVPDDLRDRVAKMKLLEKLTLVTLQTAPSWVDLAEIRVNTTESRFEAFLNRLLQRNLPFVDGSVLARETFTSQAWSVLVRRGSLDRWL